LYLAIFLLTCRKWAEKEHKAEEEANRKLVALSSQRFVFVASLSIVVMNSTTFCTLHVVEMPL
jgi:hypothetical protein